MLNNLFKRGLTNFDAFLFLGFIHFDTISFFLKKRFKCERCGDVLTKDINT